MGSLVGDFPQAVRGHVGLSGNSRELKTIVMCWGLSTSSWWACRVLNLSSPLQGRRWCSHGKSKHSLSSGINIWFSQLLIFGFSVNKIYSVFLVVENHMEINPSTHFTDSSTFHCGSVCIVCIVKIQMPTCVLCEDTYANASIVFFVYMGALTLC
ncbi:hypothetical protein Dimus_032127 [Dionaea muscipula]